MLLTLDELVKTVSNRDPSGCEGSNTGGDRDYHGDRGAESSCHLRGGQERSGGSGPGCRCCRNDANQQTANGSKVVADVGRQNWWHVALLSSFLMCAGFGREERDTAHGLPPGASHPGGVNAG